MNLRRTLSTLALGALLADLAAVAQEARSPNAGEAPTLRLPAGVAPTRYELDLTIDPARETHEGRVTIGVRLEKATSTLWLNAHELSISEVSYSSGSKSVAGEARVAGPDFVSVAFPAPVGPGEGALRLTFTGKLNPKETTGLFRQQSGGDWYVFTQMESTFARSAFPCFDEPGFKTPWALTLRVPAGLRAYANTPLVSRTEGPGSLATFTFRPTSPLPSYLVAMAVGPFEEVDAGKAGKKGTPLRVLVPRGKKDEARYAASVTREIVETLEAYFGTPFPYDKLDSIAVPQTVGFGAMENVGLITYQQQILLSRPEQETIAFRRRYASIAAHEIAHQWFGDLVTMAFWDDTWLNEGFATWMASKALERWKPEWDEPLSRVDERNDVMEQDGLVSARAVRQPIRSKDDIVNAFDGITYHKGAAVLSMFEAWAGEERFRRGVQRYLKAHAHGNATSEDFLAALAAETDKQLAPAFASFLTQPGVPLVSAELVCAAGAPKVALAQRRYLPSGSKGSTASTWKVPVCVSYGTGAERGRACTLLEKETGELSLPATACPAWLLANDGNGYYRTSYRGDLMARLLRGTAPLSEAERIGVLGDLAALVEAGELKMGEALAHVPRQLEKPTRHVVGATAGLVMKVKTVVPESLEPSYRRLIVSLYGDTARSLGFLPKPGEDEDTRILRNLVVRLVAGEGRDAALEAEAGRLARLWLDDRKALDPEVVGAVTAVAAGGGDAALFERVLAEAKKAQDQRERRTLIGMLGSFRDPALSRRAHELFLSDTFDVRESGGLLRAGLGETRSREAVWGFITSRWDGITARVPKEMIGFLPWMGAAFCDDGKKAEVEAFFKDRLKDAPGGPRNLQHAVEAISLCSAFRAANLPEVEAVLARY